MRILVIQGHPDPAGGHFGHALADAYAAGAAEAGHEVRRIEAARLGLPFLANKADWETGDPGEAVRACQEDIRWAQHLVFFFPLWLGDMPAMLKGFLEQVLRPGFAVAKGGSATAWKRLLTGRSARVVVTMGMPALAYRWFFRAHAIKSLERNVLHFVGIAPVRTTMIGMVESVGLERHRKLIDKLRGMGRRGA